MTSQNNSSNNDQVRRDEEPKKRISHEMTGNLCILYLLLMLAFLAWQLFDTWIGRYSLLTRLGYGLQRPQTLRLIAFTLIAGALGGVVNGMRSALRYHHEGFNRQYMWKYICAPWMGVTLALFVYALLRGSVAVLGGNVAGSIGNTQVLSNFAAGALVGYGSSKVCRWLDAKVKTFFQVTPPDETDKRKKVAASPSKNGKRVRPGNHARPPEALIGSRAPVPMTVAPNGRAN